MTKRFPDLPEKTHPLAVTQPSADVRNFLTQRRSPGKNTLKEPGPNSEELNELLSVAARVPDHRKLGPWRFVVFEGDSRAAFGDTLADIFKSKNPDATDDQLNEERRRFLRAPTVVAITSSPKDDGRTPVWEQELSAGAVCYNLTLAASAAGWACIWLTEWLAFDREVASAMGLEETERLAGVMYIGSSDTANPERPRPDLSERISRWGA